MENFQIFIVKLTYMILLCKAKINNRKAILRQKVSQAFPLTCTKITRWLAIALVVGFFCGFPPIILSGLIKCRSLPESESAAMKLYELSRASMLLKRSHAIHPFSRNFRSSSLALNELKPQSSVTDLLSGNATARNSVGTSEILLTQK